METFHLGEDKNWQGPDGLHSYYVGERKGKYLSKQLEGKIMTNIFIVF